MDFHESSLRAYEARQRLEDAQPIPLDQKAFFFLTSDWDSWAMNRKQLKALIKEAKSDGLSYKVETYPF